MGRICFPRNSSQPSCRLVLHSLGFDSVSLRATTLSFPLGFCDQKVTVIYNYMRPLHVPQLVSETVQIFVSAARIYMKAVLACRRIALMSCYFFFFFWPCLPILFLVSLAPCFIKSSVLKRLVSPGMSAYFHKQSNREKLSVLDEALVIAGYLCETACPRTCAQ